METNDDILELMNSCLGVPAKKPAPRTIASGKINKDSNLRYRKREAKKAAKDLKYPQDILDMIDNARTFSEVDKAMATGRHRYYD